MLRTQAEFGSGTSPSRSWACGCGFRSGLGPPAASGSPLAPQEDSMSALLSVEDAAMELGTTVRFVRRLVHERRIRFHKIGKFVRIARGDLEAFISAGEVPPLP